MSQGKTFSVNCKSAPCRYASHLLRSLTAAERKAEEHASQEQHRVVVMRTVENLVSSFGCACARGAV